MPIVILEQMQDALVQQLLTTPFLGVLLGLVMREMIIAFLAGHLVKTIVQVGEMPILDTKLVKVSVLVPQEVKTVSSDTHLVEIFPLDNKIRFLDLLLEERLQLVNLIVSLARHQVQIIQQDQEMHYLVKMPG